MQAKFLVILAVLVIGPSVEAAPEKEKPVRNHPIVEFTLRYHKRWRADISHLPEFLRAVPLHPDDGHLADLPHAWETLPDTTVFLPMPNQTDLTLIGYPIAWVGVGLTIGANEGLVPRIIGQRFGLNQFGTMERADSLSVRWYEVDRRGIRIAPAVVVTTPWYRPEMFGRRIVLRPKIGGSLGLTGHTILGRAGHFRQNINQPWKQVTLGKLIEHQVFAGVEIGLCPDPERPSAAIVQFLWFSTKTQFTSETPGITLTKRFYQNNRIQIGLGLCF